MREAQERDLCAEIGAQCKESPSGDRLVIGVSENGEQ